MTTITPDLGGAPPVRVAKEHGICRGCQRGILPGDRIVKPAGMAWQHQSCQEPYGPRRRPRRTDDK